MDTILYNGILHTMAGDRDAAALAIQKGRIVCVGEDAQVLALADAGTRKVDLQGKCVLPGFVDSHMHMLMTAVGLHRLDLRGVVSPEDIIRRGRAYLDTHTLEPGEWLVGYGYDHNVFQPPLLPDGAVAEAISPKIPVLLDRVCGHVGAANRAALQAAGFDETTVIPGGELDKDPQGRLNGILRETALDRIKQCIPRLTQDRVTELLRDMGRRLAAVGLTGVHSDDLGPEGTTWPVLWEAFRRLEAEDACRVRLWEEWEIPRPDRLGEVLPFRSGQGSDWLKVGNIKLISDGSLGARTAFLRQDYANDPGNRGIPVYTQEELDEMVALCHEADLQVACHAIGDGACAAFLHGVEKAMAQNPKPLRHRVVHCQLGSRDLYRRMGALGVGADIQPAFVPSDAPLVEPRVGDRVQASYAWKTLLESGVVLGGGSDSPVEDYAPLYGIHCAVNRPGSHRPGAAPFLPEQALTVREAVALYTTGPAKLAGAEQELGTLEAGKWADLVVLDRDIFAVPKEELQTLQVVMTLSAGRVSYQA